LKVFVRIIGLALALSILVSLCGCGTGGGKIKATCTALNNSDFYAKYFTDQEKYDYLLEGFNLTQEQKIYYLREYNYLSGVKLCIEVVNKNDFDIRIIGLEIKRNGEDDTVISTMPRAVVEIKANTKEPQKVWFDAFADGGEFTNNELLEQARGMGLKIIYVDASTGVNRLPEADKKILKYEKVR
jgi:hypothetical protein